MAFSYRVAEEGRHLHEDLRGKIRAAEVVHGDETHWRIDSESAQLWYAGERGPVALCERQCLASTLRVHNAGRSAI